jgi:hypothetical protein
MTEQDLAQALMNAGLLTQAQVESAAARRTPQKNFAQVLVELGWVTPEQIAQFDPNALPYAPPSSPWQDSSTAPQTGSFGAPNYGSGYENQPPIPPPQGYPSAYGNAAYGGVYPEKVEGTTILILGILGVTCCGICAPIAWVMGNSGMKAIDAGRADPSQRSNTSVGRILGIIGTVLLILGLLFYMFVAAATLTGRRISNTFQPGQPPSFAPAPGGFPGQ